MHRIPIEKKVLWSKTTHTVDFSESSIAYKGIEILYADALGISFSSACRAGTFMTYNAAAHVTIRPAKASIKVKFAANGSGGIGGFFAANNWLGAFPQYSELVTSVVHYVGPHILNRLVDRVLSGEIVHIGKLDLDRKGITATGGFGAQKRAPWKLIPEVSSVTKEQWYSNDRTLGILEISYHFPETGAMVVVGSTSSADENGCLMQRLIEILRPLLADRYS